MSSPSKEEQNGTIIIPPPTPNKPAIKPDTIPVIRKIIIKLINFYPLFIFYCSNPFKIKVN